MLRTTPGRLLAALGLALPASAPAQNAVGCDFSFPELSFGVYDVLAPQPNRIIAPVTLDCYVTAGRPAQPVDFSISLSAGASASFHPRSMERAGTPADRLEYNLYLAESGVVWGDGSPGTAVASGRILVNKPAQGNSRTYTLIGEIPPRQPVSAGEYFDTLIVTATWN